MYAARCSVGRQYILITPGSRSEITAAPDVRVKEYVTFILPLSFALPMRFPILTSTPFYLDLLSPNEASVRSPLPSSS